jgi:hypothetical protein
MEPTKQYVAKLDLPNYITAELVAEDRSTLKETVQTMLKGGCRFEPAGEGENQSLFIYHPTVLNGKAPFGWIAVLEVPSNMGIKSLFEQRRLQAA